MIVLDVDGALLLGTKRLRAEIASAVLRGKQRRVIIRRHPVKLGQPPAERATGNRLGTIMPLRLTLALDKAPCALP